MNARLQRALISLFLLAVLAGFTLEPQFRYPVWAILAALAAASWSQTRR